MSIKMVLFDLDGTLLPMDQEVFVGSYFKMLAGKLAPKGYDPQKLVKDIWAGIDADDFEIYTTYENSCYCKPNPDYYRDILCKLDVRAEECLMVGNDVTEDMVAETLGMKVFLLTDCLINKEDEDISVYPHGGFEDLIKYIDSI